MESSRFGARDRARRLAVPAAIAAAGVGLGSAAWACVPNEDKRTLIRSCTAPAGSPKACKVPIGQAAFPAATFVKGPSGSSVVAYVNGSGMATGRPYDLVFASRTQLEGGSGCFSSASVKLGGPTVSHTGGGINDTSGLIPANSPLGLSQLCFVDVARTLSSSTPATFKVTL